MLKKLWLNLQLFGEGGDGGDGGSADSSGEQVVDNSGEDKILASIPEKAKKYYKMAQERTQKGTSKPSEPNQPTNDSKATGKMSYADLIKSDEYKDEHKKYMDETIAKRFKKYEGMEADNGKYRELLDVVASKYGVKADAEDFLEVLKEKIDADDSYYEDYAMEHDISTDEARRIVTMERKVAQAEAQKKAEEEARQKQEHIMRLHQNAEKTKQRFPTFDLNTAMENENFRRICAVTNGDTTAAFMATNWNNIVPQQVQLATRQAQQQTANAVASNLARPKENGTSSTSPSVVQNQEDFKGMTLKEIRAYAEEQRRKKNGR